MRCAFALCSIGRHSISRARLCASSAAASACSAATSAQARMDVADGACPAASQYRPAPTRSRPSSPSGSGAPSAGPLSAGAPVSAGLGSAAPRSWDPSSSGPCSSGPASTVQTAPRRGSAPGRSIPRDAVPDRTGAPGGDRTSWRGAGDGTWELLSGGTGSRSLVHSPHTLHDSACQTRSSHDGPRTLAFPTGAMIPSLGRNAASGSGVRTLDSAA